MSTPVGLDYWTTLRPETGLVRSVGVHRPDGQTSLLWAVGADIGQRDAEPGRLAADERALSIVGACGLSRADAFVRAAGEAVERYALMPRPGLCPPAADALDIPAGALWAPTGSGAGTRYAGARISTGAPWSVPAGLVDYPARPAESLGCDPTPSGTAAGGSPRRALRAACREVLERDAAMIAWYRQVRLPRVPLYALARRSAGADAAVDAAVDKIAAGRRPGAESLARLLRAAESVGLDVRAGTTPTSLPGVGAVISIALDPGHQLVSAGLGLADSWVDSAARAVQESLQVWALLRSAAEHPAGSAAAGPVLTDTDRARYCRGAQAYAAAQAWTDAFIRADAGSGWTGSCPDDPAVILPGGVAVPLTTRLPEPIIGGGWHAVKALSSEHQPLRMNETLDWTLHPGRLRAPESEWKLDCLADADAVHAVAAHPFI